MNIFNPTDPENIPENSSWMFRYNVDNYTFSTILRCEIYKISSKTPKGCWIVPNWVRLSDAEDIKLHRKFVRNDGKKRFAHETRALAKHAFLCRKERQIQILRSQLKKAEDAYVIAGGTLPIPTRDRTWYNEYD